jgi:UDP-glucose 4-epimerase
LKYFITGGCGFIGTNLIKYIKNIEPESEIVVIDNLLYDTEHYIPNTYKLYVNNITDFPMMLRKSKDADVMIHLAANTGVIPSIEDPMYDMDINVRGLLTCLEVCRMNHINKFVYASSGAVLGDQVPPLHEKMMPCPLSPYGVSKLAGEYYCNAYYHTFDVNTISLRFSNVYGPYSYHKNSLVSKYLKAVLSGDKEFPIYGDGKQTRDFIYVDDLVRAIMLSCKSSLGGEVFQLSTNIEYSVYDILKHLEDICNTKATPTIVYENERRGEVRKSFANNSKIKEMLSFEPEWSINSGLSETVQWFMNYDSNTNKR